MNKILYLEGRNLRGGIFHNHHYLLLFAWKIKQGLLNKTKTDLLRRYVQYFFNTSLSYHLQKEEDVLLNELENCDIFKKKFLFGHNEILEKIEQVIHDEHPDYDLLESLCKTLVDVVRFEEAKFFPYLEEKLDVLQYSWIKYEIGELDDVFVDDFKPEFWKGQSVNGTANVLDN